MSDDEYQASAVSYEREGAVAVVGLRRPEVRNAVDLATAEALAGAFRRFEADADAYVAVLYGHGGHFCAGADLKAVSDGRPNRLERQGDGPMGPTRMQLSKPTIAAIEGAAVAGGLELALWCDLRVASETAYFGVHCRRWGVPLIDGGTTRLPRLIGQSRAMDMVLTGRTVSAEEAMQFGLVNRVVGASESLDAAVALANELARFPQRALRGDRLSVLEQWGLSLRDALANEFALGREALRTGEASAGARRFAAGEGRHGQAAKEP